MPRTGRSSVGGVCYHVLNRANARATIFHKDADYESFLKVLSDSLGSVPMRILGYCLMPNHFHLVVWPREDGDLSRWMQRVLTAQVRRYHEHYHTLGEGHLWQGRFKAFPIQRDEHLLTVLRYVERNPVRAGLVKRTWQWRWSSAPGRRNGTQAAWMDPGPVAWPKDWERWVNAEEGAEELDSLRECVVRGRHWGGKNWLARVVGRLGLEHSVRPRGRPRKR